MYKAERFNQAPGNFNTLKAVGKYVPDIGGQRMLGKYCKIPCGPTVVHREASARAKMLRCNEYIVFDQDSIRIKFILHCERGCSSSSLTLAVPSSVAMQIPMNLTSVTPRPLNRTPTDIVATSSTIPSSSTALMYKKRFNLPSSRLPAATTSDPDWKTIMCIAFSYC